MYNQCAHLERYVRKIPSSLLRSIAYLVNVSHERTSMWKKTEGQKVQRPSEGAIISGLVRKGQPNLRNKKKKVL